MSCMALSSCGLFQQNKMSWLAKDKGLSGGIYFPLGGALEKTYHDDFDTSFKQKPLTLPIVPFNLLFFIKHSPYLFFFINLMFL